MAGPLQGAGSAQQQIQQLSTLSRAGQAQDSGQQVRERAEDENVRTERSSASAQTQETDTKNQGDSSRSQEVAQNGFQNLSASNNNDRGTNIDITV